MMMHPSELIAEELIARGWSLDDLAVRMSIGEADFDHAYGVNRLAIEMYDTIGPDYANCRLGEALTTRLGKAFGTSAQMWVNLENAWLAEQEWGG